jgi:crotonobetainyl-CoA:carnitine CoA-transferase CaiB-like acyl-CoA transferase
LSNHYQCADGKWLLLSEAQSDRFWHNFCDAIGIENFEKDARFATAADRRNNFLEITSIIEEVFKKKTRDEWVSILQAGGGGLAFSPVLEITELSSDPQVLYNDYITEIEHPTMGKVKVVGIPVEFSGTPVRVKGYAPNFGEHTEEVLLNLCGYSWEEIEKLRDQEII